jgi:PAS domain S-box-containing protein
MEESKATQEIISGTQLEKEMIFETISSSFAVVEFKPTGIIINANRNFTDLLGYSLSEMKGHHHKMLVDMELGLSNDYAQFWNNLANGNKQKGNFKRINKYGEPVWISAYYEPVFNRDGGVVKIMKVALDISAFMKKEIQYLEEIGLLKSQLKTAKGNEVDRVIDQLGDMPSSMQHKKMSYTDRGTDSHKAANVIADNKNYKLALPSLDGLTFVDIADIVYCEADSNYTIFFMVDGRQILVSQTLKEYEQPLARYRFFRIHHSYLININMIKQYIRGEGGRVVR